MQRIETPVLSMLCSRFIRRGTTKLLLCNIDTNSLLVRVLALFYERVGPLSPDRCLNSDVEACTAASELRDTSRSLTSCLELTEAPGSMAPPDGPSDQSADILKSLSDQLVRVGTDLDRAWLPIRRGSLHHRLSRAWLGDPCTFPFCAATSQGMLSSTNKRIFMLPSASTLSRATLDPLFLKPYCVGSLLF